MLIIKAQLLYFYTIKSILKLILNISQYMKLIHFYTIKSILKMSFLDEFNIDDVYFYTIKSILKYYVEDLNIQTQW